MAPTHDDHEITNNHFVLRVLLAKWLTTKGGRERPTSESMKDSNQEISCFIEGEIPLAELFQLFEYRKIARIPVSVLRTAGYAIERRPTEAPNCSNPEAHVVVGPIPILRRNDYERASRRIVTDEQVTILAPEN